MRGVFLIGTLLSLLIGAYITVKRRNTVPSAAKRILSTEFTNGQLKKLSDLPNAVKLNMEKQMKDREKMLEDQLNE